MDELFSAFSVNAFEIEAAHDALVSVMLNALCPGGRVAFVRVHRDAGRRALHVSLWSQHLFGGQAVSGLQHPPQHLHRARTGDIHGAYTAGVCELRFVVASEEQVDRVAPLDHRPDLLLLGSGLGLSEPTQESGTFPPIVIFVARSSRNSHITEDVMCASKGAVSSEPGSASRMGVDAESIKNILPSVLVPTAKNWLINQRRERRHKTAVCCRWHIRTGSSTYIGSVEKARIATRGFPAAPRIKLALNSSWD